MGELNYTGSKIEGQAAQSTTISFKTDLKLNKPIQELNHSNAKITNNIVDLSLFLKEPSNTKQEKTNNSFLKDLINKQKTEITTDPNGVNLSLPTEEYLKAYKDAPYTLNGQLQAPTLVSPTQAVKYNDIYFIANTFSTYDNRIMFSYDKINWTTIDAPDDLNFNKPHSVAFDGKNLIITDTDNKRMLLYEFKDGNFVYSSTFNDNNLNPRFHYVTYDEETDTYFGVASEFDDNTRTYKFKIKDGQFISPDGKPLIGQEIKDTNNKNYVSNNNSYVRSLTIEQDRILMPIHNRNKECEILVMDKDYNTQKTIKLNSDIGGVTCIKEINGYYVLTSLTNQAGERVNSMCIAKNIEDFEIGKYKKIDPSVYYGDTNPDASPYFIEYYDNRYWLTVNGGPPVCTIEVDDLGIITVNDSYIR